MFIAGQAPAQMPRFCLNNKSMRALPVVPRRAHAGHHTKLMMPCKAVNALQAKDESQGKHPKLPYDVLEKAFIQQKLQNMEMQRAYQQSQAQIAQSEAVAKKAKRVITKGARRSREITSRARLLDTKLDRLAKESDIPQLHATIEEKEEDVQRAQLDAAEYKKKFWRTMEEKEEEAYAKRKAFAAKVEAEKQTMDVEAERQRDLQWYHETINTGKVFGQFLFELCVKALPLPSLTTNTEASQQDKQGSKVKASNERAKQQARFL